MSDLLLLIVLIIVSIILLIQIFAIYFAIKDIMEEKKEKSIIEEKKPEKIKLHATRLNFLKPHPLQIGQGGKLVLELESKTHKIGICFKKYPLEELYENIGLLIKLDCTDLDTRDIYWEDDGEEEPPIEGDENCNYVNPEIPIPEIKTKITFKKDEIDLRCLYS